LETSSSGAGVSVKSMPAAAGAIRALHVRVVVCSLQLTAR
jgi:hypothetical protein